MKTKNLSEPTNAALESWLVWPTIHDLDEERFYKFAYEYIKNEDSIEKSDFVKRLKQTIYAANKEYRGFAQKYFQKLDTIQEFGKILREKGVKLL